MEPGISTSVKTVRTSPLFQYRNGLDPGAGLDNVKAGILDDRGGGPPQQDFVFDDEHDRPAARMMLHGVPISLNAQDCVYRPASPRRCASPVLCRISDKGNAALQMGETALCSGNRENCPSFFQGPSGGTADAGETDVDAIVRNRTYRTGLI